MTDTQQEAAPSNETTNATVEASDEPEVTHTVEEGAEPVEYIGDRQRGTCKWFSVNKGFGFIQPDDGDEEIFVHQTSIKAEGFRSLRESEPVEYDLERGEDGRGKAINVTGPHGSPPQGAPRRVVPSAMPFPMPGAIVPAQQFGFYDPYAAYPPIFRAGRFPGRGFPMPARGGYAAYGRGYGPPLERPPPPGTPGISSGFQVVVHNLPWSVTWQVLKDVFAHTSGLVRADVIIDSAGRSRGFGTVRYKSREEAIQAAEMMNNANIGGRIVTVRIDRFA